MERGSKKDFLKKDCGIILMETVIWLPIGPWKVRGTTPVGVRVRKAIQYSDRMEDNIAYFGSWDGNVYAVDTSNGNVKWIFETGWGIDTTPAVSDDIVFVGSMDNNFYAIDKENGDLKWFFTCLAGIHSLPVLYGEFVFFGSDDGRLYALNKETGDLE